MADNDNGASKNWWATLPGILTGLATLIAAITGLIVALHSSDTGGKPPPSVPSGWYGFENSNNKDREFDLVKNCHANFKRVIVPAGITFNDLCGSIGKSCAKVCSWGGAPATCDEHHYEWGDGSQIALCE